MNYQKDRHKTTARKGEAGQYELNILSDVVHDKLKMLKSKSVKILLIIGMVHLDANSSKLIKGHFKIFRNSLQYSENPIRHGSYSMQMHSSSKRKSKETALVLQAAANYLCH